MQNLNCLHPIHSCVSSPARVHPGISLMSAICLLRLKKAFTTKALVLYHWIPDTQITVRLMPLTNTHCCPFNHDSWWQLASYCISTPDFFCPRTQLQCPWQRATRNFWSFQTWWHYLKALDFRQCGHWSLEFAILFQWQNPHMLTSMLV